jgi:hypothetical protein
MCCWWGVQLVGLGVQVNEQLAVCGGCLAVAQAAPRHLTRSTSSWRRCEWAGGAVRGRSALVLASS